MLATVKQSILAGESAHPRETLTPIPTLIAKGLGKHAGGCWRGRSSQP